jgi:predicted acyl esterase
LYLTAEGALADAPTAGEATTLLAQDTRSRHTFFTNNPTVGELPDDPLEAIDDVCATCVAFTLAAPDGLRVSGAPEVFVEVTPTAESGHVAALLYRRGEDGLHRLGWGATDLRFPAGQNGGEEEPAEVTPGAPVALRIELDPLEAVVPAGEELVLILGQGHDAQMPGRPFGPVQLGYGNGNGVLRLNTPTPDASQFFTPPGPEGRRLP